ncbi:hypothetical protein ENBRE01_2435, partial [Enteropsectra breve]
MFSLTILTHPLWNAEQAVPEGSLKTDAQIFKDIMDNRAAIFAALDNNQTYVDLPCALPTIKQIYTTSELREYLDQEKEAENNDANKADNDKDDDTCKLCFESFFIGKDYKSIFRDGIYQTHNPLVKCVMCANPFCRTKICYACTRTLIKGGSKVGRNNTRLKYNDTEKKPIPDSKMVKCEYCTHNCLNVEPYELDAIPDNQSLSERLKLLEDLVYSQNKTY